MDLQRRNNLALGLVLLLIGGLLLAVRIFPSMGSWLEIRFAWPMFVIGAGLLLLLIGLLVRTPEMAVPAAIVTGVGCLLYWQNATGRWESWAYAWTLIPGFVGIGTILSGLLGRNPRQSLREGGSLIFISLIMFAIFSSFLGGRAFFGNYWPLLLILLGLWILIRPLFRAK